MTWKQVREAYPQTWLLFEATQAHSEGKQRIVEQVAVVETFPTSQPALQKYRELHRADNARELYVAHTSREDLAIIETNWAGIRPS